MERKEKEQCQTAYLFNEQIVVDAHEKKEYVQRNLEYLAGFLCECAYFVAGIQVLPVAKEQRERTCECSEDCEKLNWFSTSSRKDVEPQEESQCPSEYCGEYV